MSLRTDIQKLSDATGAGGCPGCGRDAGGVFRPSEDTTFEIVTDPEANNEPEPCPECGRPQLQFTLVIGPLRGEGDE